MYDPSNGFTKPTTYSWNHDAGENGCGVGTDCRNCGARKPVLDVALDWGHAEAWEQGMPSDDTTALLWADVNGDGYDDLVEINDGAPNRVWKGDVYSQNVDGLQKPYGSDEPHFRRFGAWKLEDGGMDTIYGTEQPILEPDTSAEAMANGFTNDQYTQATRCAAHRWST